MNNLTASENAIVRYLEEWSDIGDLKHHIRHLLQTISTERARAEQANNLTKAFAGLYLEASKYIPDDIYSAAFRNTEVRLTKQLGESTP